jgi:hypothetical protein
MLQWRRRVEVSGESLPRPYTECERYFREWWGCLFRSRCSSSWVPISDDIEGLWESTLCEATLAVQESFLLREWMCVEVSDDRGRSRAFYVSRVTAEIARTMPLAATQALISEQARDFWTSFEKLRSSADVLREAYRDRKAIAQADRRRAADVAGFHRSQRNPLMGLHRHREDLLCEVEALQRRKEKLLSIQKENEGRRSVISLLRSQIAAPLKQCQEIPEEIMNIERECARAKEIEESILRLQSEAAAMKVAVEVTLPREVEEVTKEYISQWNICKGLRVDRDNLFAEIGTVDDSISQKKAVVDRLDREIQLRIQRLSAAEEEISKLQSFEMGVDRQLLTGNYTSLSCDSDTHHFGTKRSYAAAVYGIVALDDGLRRFELLRKKLVAGMIRFNELQCFLHELCILALDRLRESVAFNAAGDSFPIELWRKEFFKEQHDRYLILLESLLDRSSLWVCTVLVPSVAAVEKLVLSLNSKVAGLAR